MDWTGQVGQVEYLLFVEMCEKKAARVRYRGCFREDDIARKIVMRDEKVDI